MLNGTVKSRQRGVTAVEMAITAGLVAVLFAVAMPSFSAWQGNSRIRASADTIHAGLRLARAEAVTRNASVTFTLQADGSWTVGCATVTTECPAVLHSRPGAEVQGSLTLTRVQRDAVVASAATTVTFNSRGVPDAADESLRRIDLDVPGWLVPSSHSRDLRIVLSDFGQTRLCDPNAASGSPLAC